MLKIATNVWAGEEHEDYLPFDAEMGVFSCLPALAGDHRSEQNPIKIRSQLAHGFACTENASFGRKHISLKVISRELTMTWSHALLSARSIGLHNCPGNLVCSKVAVRCLKSLRQQQGKMRPGLWFLLWNSSDPGFFSINIRVGSMPGRETGWGELPKR